MIVGAGGLGAAHPSDFALTRAADDRHGPAAEPRCSFHAALDVLRGIGEWCV